jgi:hypothetical protein
MVAQQKPRVVSAQELTTATLQVPSTSRYPHLLGGNVAFDLTPRVGWPRCGSVLQVHNQPQTRVDLGHELQRHASRTFREVVLVQGDDLTHVDH